MTSNNYLAHYGRKGMKWGKNIFKSDENYSEKSRDLAAAARDRLTEAADSNIKKELIGSKRIQNVRKRAVSELADVISGALGSSSARRRTRTKHAILEAERSAMRSMSEKRERNRRNREKIQPLVEAHRAQKRDKYLKSKGLIHLAAYEKQLRNDKMSDIRKGKKYNRGRELLHLYMRGGAINEI